PPSPSRWWHVYGGEYDGWGKSLNWSDLRAQGHLLNKLRALESLAGGVVGWDGQTNKPIIHKAWPGPNKEQAAHLLGTLKSIHNAQIQPNGTYPASSWHQTIYGDVDKHDLNGVLYLTHQTSGVIRDFFPDREEEARKTAAKCDELWEKVLTNA